MQETLTLTPRLDMVAAAALWQRITATEADLALDASLLRHAGAAGLQVLLMADRLARQANRRITVTDPSPAIRELLAMVALPALMVAQDGEQSA